MENALFWILTAAYAAHILEEYTLDWLGWTRKVSKFKMSWAEFFVANFAVIVLGVCCSAVGFSYPEFAYMFVGLAVVNAIFAHIGTTLVKRRFSPGIITAVLLFIPISCWGYAMAYEKGIMTPKFMVITLGGGFLIMSFPILLQLLKRKLIKETDL